MRDSECGQLDWSVAQRPFPGERESGDGHLVVEISSGWLLAVVDGLGHGSGAADARRACIETIARHAEKPLTTLFRLSDEALKSTRGCVGSLVVIDRNQGRLEWCGVGNVEGVLVHADGQEQAARTEYITSRGGIIGYRLPDLQPTSPQFMDNDLLVLATDGIDTGFVQLINQRRPPDQLAAAILELCAKPTDDALVLAARWQFPPSRSKGASS